TVFLLRPIDSAASRQERSTLPLLRPSLRSHPRRSIQSSRPSGDMTRQAGFARIALGSATNGPLIFRLRFMKFLLAKCVADNRTRGAIRAPARARRARPCAPFPPLQYRLDSAVSAVML